MNTLTTTPPPSAIAGDLPAVAARTESRRKVSHGFYTLMDQGVVSLVSAVTTVLVGRACSKEELGIFSLGTSLLWRALGVPTSLVWSPYSARAPHYSSRRLARFRGSAAVHAVALGVVQAVVLAVLVLSVIGIRPLFPTPHWLVPLLLGLIPLVLFSTLREHARRICVAEFRGRELLALDLPLGLLQVTGLATLWSFGWLTVESALWGMAVASALSLIWFLVERPRWQIRWRLAVLQMRANFRFGGWLLAVSVAWLVCDLALRGLLTWFHGLEAMGTYASASTIVNLMNPLILAATTYSRALAARILAMSGGADLWQFALRGSAVALALAASCTLALGLWGDKAVELVFGAPYASPWVVVALAVGLGVQGVAIPVEAAQMALEQGRELFLVSLLRLLLIALVGVPLVWWFGAAGIGLTLAAQGATTMSANWVFLARSER